MIYLIDIVISLVLAFVALISSNNYYVAIIVLIISILYFVLIFNRKIAKYKFKTDRYHECYKFINTFITSLSVTNSIMAAFERTTLRISATLQTELKGISNLEVVDKIIYLKKYFPFHVYELFLNILNLFIEQGGDILKMSSYLLKEARLIEEYIDAVYHASLKRIIELIFLWILTFAILLFIRFGLGDFFTALSNNIYYPISILGFMVFVLFSIDFSVKKLFDIEIRGFKGYEKNKKINKRIKS